MKKIFLAIAIILMMGISISAQNDFFFRSYNEDGYNNRDSWGQDNPGIIVPNGDTPGEYSGDEPAPLGSGLLVLTALGAGYAVTRKKK